MADTDNTAIKLSRRQRGRARIERILRGEDYSVVLALLTIAFVMTNLTAETLFMHIVNLLLQGMTLMVALLSSQVRRCTLIAGGVLFVVSGSIFLFANVSGISQPFRWVWFVGALLLSATALTIVQHIARSTVIDGQTILGALSSYILLGMFFAYFDAFFGTFQSFFTSPGYSNIQQYLYFSYVTLSTVGYGDLIPRGNVPRMLSVMEALSGQLYLVVFVALVVSNYGRVRTPKRR